MRKKYIWLLTIATGFTLVFGGLPSVYAQKSDGDEFTLEEITVTAEKHIKDVQKTSLSVSVLTGDQIQEKSYNAITDMLQNVVGLQIQGAGGSNNNGAKLFIRGIGLNNLDTAYGDPAIALNVDGIQQQRGIALTNSTMDVERVEVLRGPQGTMYGRNATGGAVNIVMVQPKDKFEASARMQLGNYNAQTYEAMINVPIDSKLALRVSGIKDKRDTYMTYPGAEGYQDQTTSRLKVQYKPNDDLSLIGTVEYRKDKSQSNWGSVPYSALSSNDPWSVSPSSANSGSSSSIWNDSMNYSLNLVWNIMDMTTFTFIPSMSKNKLHQDLSKLTAGGAGPEPYPNSTQYTYEARFASAADSKVTWTLGGFLWDSSVSNAAAQLSTAAGWQISQGDRPTGSWAAFGQATYPVTDRFRAIAGLRYSFDKKKQDYRVYYNDANGVKTYDSGIVSYGENITKPTYKVGMEYDLGTASMAYLTASSGYKSGGVTFDSTMLQGDPSGTSYELTGLAAHKFGEENSMSYELGSKNKLLNNRLQINGDLFLTAYKGMQVQMWKRINATDLDPSMFILNAGKTNTYGAEIETTLLVTSNDRVTSSISSMYGKYHDLIVQNDLMSFQGGGSGTPTNLDGVTMANMPKLTLQLGYTHTFDLADYGTMSTTLDSTYKTKYYNSIEISNAGCEVPSYHISDFYLSWISPKGMWSASANVKNIENKAIALMASAQGVTLNSPRTYSASLTVKY